MPRRSSGCVRSGGTRRWSATSRSARTDAGSRLPGPRPSACGRGTRTFGSQKGTPPFLLRGHVQRVWGVAIAPDSRHVTSVSADGTVRTYLCEASAAPKRGFIRKARARLQRLEANLTPDERKRYFGFLRAAAGALLELVGLRGQRAEARRRKSLIAPAASTEVSRRPVRGARTCVAARPAPIQVPIQRVQVTKLADRLLHLRVVGGLLILLAVDRLAFHERLPHEARHLVAGDRPGGLERRETEQREVDRLQLEVRLSPRCSQAADRPEPGQKGAHDRGVPVVGRLFGHR